MECGRYLYSSMILKPKSDSDSIVRQVQSFESTRCSYRHPILLELPFSVNLVPTNNFTQDLQDTLMRLMGLRKPEQTQRRYQDT